MRLKLARCLAFGVLAPSAGSAAVIRNMRGRREAEGRAGYYFARSPRRRRNLAVVQSGARSHALCAFVSIGKRRAQGRRPDDVLPSDRDPPVLSAGLSRERRRREG